MTAEVDFRTYKYLSIVLAVLCAISSLIAAAELLETDISGIGKFFIQHDFSNAGDVAATSNGTVIYKYSYDTTSGPTSAKTLYIVQGAKGTYEDQYAVWGSAAGEVVRYEITKIFGEFQGSQDTEILIEPSGDEGFINLILLRGNASYEGRVRAFNEKGHPIDQETMFATGDFVVRSYINTTKPIETPEDWLAFCKEIEIGITK